MKKISSKSAPVYRKIVAFGFLIQGIFATQVLHSQTNDLRSYFIVTPWLALSVFLYFKKSQVVYIDKNDFVVNGKKILMRDVISIRKKFLILRYKVRYYENINIKSFTFDIDSFPLTKPDFMKKLQALAKKNNHNPNII